MTPHERAVADGVDKAHRELARCVLALKRQLERIGQEQIVTPLSEALRAEGDAINELVLLARWPSIDSGDMEEARELNRELVRETVGEWGSRR